MCSASRPGSTVALPGEPCCVGRFQRLTGSLLNGESGSFGERWESGVRHVASLEVVVTRNSPKGCESHCPSGCGESSGRGRGGFSCGGYSCSGYSCSGFSCGGFSCGRPVTAVPAGGRSGQTPEPCSVGQPRLVEPSR